MKIKVSIEKFLFTLILYYHVINLFTATFLADFSTRVVQVFLIVLYIFFVKNGKSKRDFVTVNLLLIFYFSYNMLNYHVYQVLHSDFYSFILLGLIFVVYGNENLVYRFYMYLRTKERQYLFSTMLFFLFLLFTMLFKDGLKSGFGTTLPVLYGPYSVPHMLGYILIVMYCTNAFFQRMTGKKVYLILKSVCIVCVIWTSARSAVLGLAIVMIADYISIKNYSRRLLVTGGLLIVAFYLLLFTNIITNNPLIQKTIVALENGSITNGRALFVEVALDYYSIGTTFIEKSFGIGMNNVRNIFLSTSSIGVAIHAHNDYVNALVGYGLLGLMIYIIGQLRQIRAIRGQIMKILAEVLIFMLAYYNGLAMYAMFTPCLIIVYTFMNQRFYLENN